MVRVERPHMVVDGRHGGVVAHCPSDDASAARVELPENRVKALIGLMARANRCRTSTTGPQLEASA
jgi:hypothetical protein